MSRAATDSWREPRQRNGNARQQVEDLHEFRGLSGFWFVKGSRISTYVTVGQTISLGALSEDSRFFANASAWRSGASRCWHEAAPRRDTDKTEDGRLRIENWFGPSPSRQFA
jgi:hypothetical protein